MPQSAPQRAATFRAAEGLRYLFIDFNAYFAAAEQHDDPSLYGKPVVVAPTSSRHTGAIAVSYEARPYGIKRGTPIHEALALCPDLTVRVARHDLYVRLHKQLMAAIETVLPLYKRYSVDEAACRLSPSEALSGPAMNTAQEVKAQIKRLVGPAFRSSIGLAQSQMLAKLAAEMNKPDGLTVLTPEDMPGKLLDIPLEQIPGIGHGVAQRLRKNNVHDFFALWQLDPRHARQIWGSVQGERFCYALHGFDIVEPPTKKSVIGHSRVLSREHRNPEPARIVARALVLKAASRLRRYDMMATRFSLSVKRLPDGRWDGESRFTPSQDSYLFLRHLNTQWARFIKSASADASAISPLTVSIYLHGLHAKTASAMGQGDLFANPIAQQNERKNTKLWALIDQINEDAGGTFARLAATHHKDRTTASRHVMLATQQGLDLNYLGAKIAFSRVPDEAEFS